MITVEIPDELIKEIRESPIFKLYINEGEFIRATISKILSASRMGESYKITWDDLNFTIFETPPKSKQYTIIATLSESKIQRLYQTLNPKETKENASSR